MNQGITRRALVLGCGAMAKGAAAGASPAKLSGTFLQLAGVVGAWGPAEWSRAFDRFRDLGLEEVILQWSATVPEGILLPAVPVIANESRRAQMGVWLGLVHDQTWWKHQHDQSFLNQLASRSIALMPELRIAARGCRLRGFYLPQEVDDVNWRTPDHRALLLDFISQQVRAAGRVGVAISGFSNREMPPIGFSRWCRDLVRQSGLNAFFFQDGVGVRKQTLESLPEYVENLRKTLGRRARAVVELFTQTSLEGEPFQAIPAEAARIDRQLEITRKLKPVGFSVPEYMFGGRP